MNTKFISFHIFFFLVGSFIKAQDKVPIVKNIGLITEDILCITVEEGKYVPGEFVPYKKQESDVIQEEHEQTWLIRDGKRIGFIAGPKHQYFRGYDKIIGERISDKAMANPSNFVITSSTDPKFLSPQTAKTVYRKVRTLKVARTGEWSFDCSRKIHLFLQFKSRLSPGHRYKIEVKNTPLLPIEFTLNLEELRSEAIHVNHLGFTPESPVKIGFISCWMGDGGRVSYKEGMVFHLLEASSNKKVFTGKVVISRRYTENECGNKNYTGTDVYQMDFSEYKIPGTYKLYVENIGTSYPFEINNKIWEKALLVSLKGILHNRSGIELGPPYTDYVRPRTMHPDDGITIWATAEDVFHGDDKEGFEKLVKAKLDYTVDNAWGGLMDAGDWDRRSFHLVVSRNLIELCLLYPEYFNKLNTNNPESNNALPDLIDEALFNLDCYKRMQLPNGGVRGGIESASHPKLGEPSWLESQMMFAYAPDIYSTYEYAATAARVSYWFYINNYPKEAEEYKQSALRAMAWADSAYAKKPMFKARDSKNLAAVELFRLTGEEKWHKMFLKTTVYTSELQATNLYEQYDQQEAPFVYLTTLRRGKDPQIMEFCLKSMCNQANITLESSFVTAFKWAKNYYAPMGFSNASTPQEAPNLLRVYYLTKEEKYLKGAILISQAGLGANPVNITYTTGLGYDYPKFPLHEDSYVTGQEAPKGITIYGPLDPTFFENGWWCDPIFDSDQLNTGMIFIYPKIRKWPPFESYFDLGRMNPLMCEYTVMQNHAIVTYTWGSLSAIYSK